MMLSKHVRVMKFLMPLLVCLSLGMLAMAVLFKQGAAQSSIALEVRKAELQQEIEQYKQSIRTEKQDFARYLNDKTRLLGQKRDELKRVSSEVRTKERELDTYRRQIASLEAELDSLEQRDRELLTTLSERAERLSQEVDSGIPFEREQRRSALRSIINDSLVAGVNGTEIFNRLSSFLRNEQTLAYDSQVTRALATVAGSSQTVTVLRVGRVLFAVDTGTAVYLYGKTADDPYALLDDEPVGFVLEQQLRDMIAMIQGSLPPDLISVTLPNVIAKVRK